jgi:hypothetical protein
MTPSVGTLLCVWWQVNGRNLEEIAELHQSTADYIDLMQKETVALSEVVPALFNL